MDRHTNIIMQLCICTTADTQLHIQAYICAQMLPLVSGSSDTHMHATYVKTEVKTYTPARLLAMETFS